MKPLLIYISLFTSTINFGYAQSLDDYLKEASENNPGLKSIFTEYEASLERISQVNALPDPTLSIGEFVSPIETRLGAQRAKISLTQPFPWFGTLKAKENLSTLETEAKYQEFLNAKNELYFKVKKAYYPLYEIKEQLMLMEAYLDILEIYKQLATTAVANNKASMVDVIRVDILMEDMHTDILLLQDKMKPYSVAFNRLLNKPDSATIVVADSLLLLVIESQKSDTLLASNPLLKAMESQIQAANAMELVAKKRGLPQFGVGLDYAIISKRTDMDMPHNGRDVVMPMVSMSLPIFRSKYQASVAEARLLQTAMEYKKEDLENRLFSSYETAWYELEQAQQLIALYNKQMAKTKLIVDLLYVAYSNSGKDFEEVLRMEQQLLKYQIALTSAKVQFYTALAQLDFITAKLN